MERSKIDYAKSKDGWIFKNDVNIQHEDFRGKTRVWQFSVSTDIWVTITDHLPGKPIKQYWVWISIIRAWHPMTEVKNLRQAKDKSKRLLKLHLELLAKEIK